MSHHLYVARRSLDPEQPWRIPDLCQQALSQGALLTAEDLAYRVFFVTPRTISRDLIAVRQANPDVLIPMRSTLHDLGPVLTHRTQIVRLRIEHDEESIAASVEALREQVARAVDWHEWVKRWPAHAIAGAFVLGFVLGHR